MGCSVWRKDPTWSPDVFENNALYNGPIHEDSLFTSATGVILLDGTPPLTGPDGWQAYYRLSLLASIAKALGASPK